MTIWTEACIQRERADMSSVYPAGMDAAIADGIADEGFILRTAGLDDPDHGLPPETLETTDVLVWWGHEAHEDVSDDLVDRVQRRVLSGMGLVVLHSGHHSKIFKRLMGTSCNLAWRERPQGETERVWIVSPSHPVAEGLPSNFDIPQSEMYGEPFDIPTPDELVFLSWFQGGEVFRSGCAFRRGRGRIFYFGPGHETFPIYFNPHVRRVIANAIRWARQPHADGRVLENWHRPHPHPLET
ncbi:MAG: ThuA domain-containing protein [Boseongicola sp.]|nr:ThuA domain-containing protein [Boseongicola sp.]